VLGAAGGAGGVGDCPNRIASTGNTSDPEGKTR